ncbi:serine/threonine protein kinase [Fusarium oxysporum f. sp. lycopersici 4287]|uniref:Serine/threonine protein kinase n=2 Tax=Fusarium oxysporum TaxID=5507 RepID=A0A0J9WN04_FUSO4|nr:serine/threonine protein kinase [Fusarium oxysporum f. sp. lycopersici 4287]KAJ9419472.1 serine/threonine protein kinase [Fusarium oxysporum]KNB06437.1 serine/threonine protein kinase [Fusarium oxysporum f. sp. lycopersici 4287]
MEVNFEFERLSLGPRGMEESSSHSFVGFSIDPSVTEALCADGQAAAASSVAEQGISVESFFEECHDAGVEVFSESDFDKGPFIGSGATMLVYKAVWRDRCQKVALKYFQAPLTSRYVDPKAQSDVHRRLLEASMLEMRVLTAEAIKWHENIPKLLGVSWHRSGSTISPILIMELACEEHPTLAHFMKTPRPTSVRLELIRDVLEGLSALHAMTIVHGDIKPENILIFSSSSATGFSARLSDFGFCRPAADYKWGAGGTPYWNAPECLSGAPSALKAESFKNARDIYSFGLLICYILTGDMPFGCAATEDPTRLKLDDQATALISGSLQGDSAPFPEGLIGIVGRMVSLQPADRPLVDEIRTVLSALTSERAAAPVPQEHSSDAVRLTVSVLHARFNGAGHGVGDFGSSRTLDRALPRDFQDALYKTIIGVADTGNSQDRAIAANRLGVFLLNGFGTLKNFRPAFEWFYKAAKLGSVEAKKMVYRMERAAETLPERVKADLTRDERASWMIDIIMNQAKTSNYDRRLAPEGLDLEAVNERIRQVLVLASPYTVRHGLIRDMEHNVVRMLMLCRTFDPLAAETLKQVHAAAASVPIHAEALQCTFANDAEALVDILSNHTVPTSFLNRLVTVASDRCCNRVLKTLCVKYGADPDYIDQPSGRQLCPVLVAAMDSDLATVTTLLNCGADARPFLALAPRIISESSYGMAGVLVGLYNTETAHQLLDGLQLAMNSPANPREEMPLDNTNPPPLFKEVIFNSLEHLHSLLLWGANPNVRFNGWTAVHVAVKMLHPSALLFLLAFGADPNARCSREGYTTPLHTLSEVRIRMPEGGGKKGKMVDFLLRPYEPLPLRVGSDELLHRQALIVHILLQFGADPSLCCVDGFTPLMTSLVSPSPDATALTGVLLQSGVSLGDRSSRGESVLHLCASLCDHVHLEQFLRLGAKSIIDSKDRSGCTSLFLACLQDNSRDVVKTLLDNGADILIRGTRNMSPLDAAMLTADPGTLEEVFEHLSTLPEESMKMLCSGTSEDGRTVLHYCLSCPDISVSTNALRQLIALIPLDITKSLITRPDAKGCTPWQLACTGNRTVCETISSFVGVINVAYDPFAGLADTILCTVEDISNSRQECLETIEGNRSTRMAELEDVGLDRGLELVEASYQAELDEAIRSEGEHSREATWRMNTLGTVHERYGWLKRAQEVYYQGWKMSMRVPGPTSPLTQDFASKIVRVLGDRGAENELLDVVEWHARHGADTITGGIVLHHREGHEGNTRPPLIGGVEDTTVAGLPESQVCSRKGCTKPPRIVCHGCKYASYCSENCKVQDIVDPAVQHLSVCFPTEQVGMSQAVTVQSRSLHDPDTRNIVQLVWEESPMTRRRPAPPAPAVVRVAMGKLTPRFFNKPVRFRLPPNSLMIFLKTHLYEVRYDMKSKSPWVRVNALASYVEMHAAIRPIPEAVEAAEREAGAQDGAELTIWFEVGFDFDLKGYFEGQS